jgi:hypothetical protein
MCLWAAPPLIVFGGGARGVVGHGREFQGNFPGGSMSLGWRFEITTLICDNSYLKITYF